MIKEKRDPETYQIIGAAMNVHTELGSGFMEAVYQEAFEKELKIKHIPYEREKNLSVFYKGELLKTHYRADFLCFNSIIVELKALTSLSSNEESQILNYLKASGCKRGLLINFGTGKLDYKRYIYTKERVNIE